jgi:adenine-specific DNA-methyltransferase
VPVNADERARSNAIDKGISLISYFLKAISAERRGGFIEQKPVYVSQVPIKKPTPSQEHETSILVDRMLSLHEDLSKLENKKTDDSIRIIEDIELASKKIDEIIYDLYDISVEEKILIEESMSSRS